MEDVADSPPQYCIDIASLLKGVCVYVYTQTLWYPIRRSVRLSVSVCVCVCVFIYIYIYKYIAVPDKPCWRPGARSDSSLTAAGFCQYDEKWQMLLLLERILEMTAHKVSAVEIK